MLLTKSCHTPRTSRYMLTSEDYQFGSRVALWLRTKTPGMDPDVNREAIPKQIWLRKNPISEEGHYGPLFFLREKEYCDRAPQVKVAEI